MEAENNQSIPFNTVKDEDPSRTELLDHNNSTQKALDKLSHKEQVKKLLQGTPSFVLGSQDGPDYTCLADVVKVPERGIQHMFFMMFAMLVSLSKSENLVDTGIAQNLPLFVDHLTNFNSVYRSVVVDLMVKCKVDKNENFTRLFDQVEESMKITIESFEDFKIYGLKCSGKSYEPLLKVVKALFMLHADYVNLFSAVNNTIEIEVQKKVENVNPKKKEKLLRSIAREMINRSRKSSHAGDCVYVLVHWMSRSQRRNFGRTFTSPITAFRFLKKLKGYI